jgi:hypothetical protein
MSRRLPKGYVFYASKLLLEGATVPYLEFDFQPVKIERAQ